MRNNTSPADIRKFLGHAWTVPECTWAVQGRGGAQKVHKVLHLRSQFDEWSVATISTQLYEDCSIFNWVSHRLPTAFWRILDKHCIVLRVLILRHHELLLAKAQGLHMHANANVDERLKILAATNMEQI